MSAVHPVQQPESSPPGRLSPTVLRSNVRGVRLFELPHFADHRGSLSVGEFGREIPFRALRYFLTFGVPGEEVRGEHAHKVCEQFFICVSGACTVRVDDGVRREEHLLDRPTLGIYVPPMVWALEHKHSPDSRLLVFASHHYDAADYIRNYGEFLDAVAKR